MNRSRLFLRICYFGTLALSLLAVVLRTVALLVCYDDVDSVTGAALGYFEKGTLPTVCSLLCIAAVVLPIVCLLFLDRESARPRMQQAIVKPEIFACIPAVALLATSFLYTQHPLDPARADKTWYHALLTWMTIAGVCAALFFATRCIKKIGKIPSIVLSIAPMAWAVLCIAYTYFSLLTTMNDATKLALQMGLVAAVLAITAETRALLDRFAPRSGLLFYSTSVFFCFNASIPTLISRFCGVRHPMLYFLLAMALLGFAVYNTFRLSCLVFACLNEPATDDIDPSEPNAENLPDEKADAAIGGDV